jgi:integrase/recombinase XerD
MQICIMKPHTAIILDTRRALKTDKYPVKLRVTFQRKQRYFATECQLTKNEFDVVMGKAPKGKSKDIRLSLEALEQKANGIISKTTVFDFGSFEHSLYSDQLVYGDVYSYYQAHIDTLKDAGQIGTASNYMSSLNSLKEYKSQLVFGEITVDFLNKYEKWLLKEKKSITTVGIYLRPLRAILNKAISEDLVNGDYKYPFGLKSKGKYQIPTGRNIKKALDKTTLKKIFDYVPESGTWEEKAHDYWIFIYLANGMNLMDVAHLKRSDIDGEYIRFQRAKTKKTSSNNLPISVYIQDRMNAIIARQGNKSKDKSFLIFPIIDPLDTPSKQRADVQQMNKMINKYIKRIAAKLEIDAKVTIYTARHTFSTILKRSGVDIQNISEALGHSSVSTTKAYLDSFDDESKKIMAGHLVNL